MRGTSWHHTGCYQIRSDISGSSSSSMGKRMTKRCIAMLVIALAGCATTIKLHTAPSGLLSESGDEALVIGRVDGGGPLPYIPVARSEFFDRLVSITLSVRERTTGRTHDIVCDEKGGYAAHFYVALPPGRYSVTKIRKGEPGPGQQASSALLPYEIRFSGRGRLSKGDPEGRELTFEIGRAPAGSPPAVIYLGTLEISRQQDFRDAYTDFLGIPRPAISYMRGWAVRDDYDEMVKTFRGKYPQATQAISKSLMKD